MSSAVKRAPDYDLKDAALVDLLDKHHAELRFAKFSPDIGKLPLSRNDDGIIGPDRTLKPNQIAFNLGVALREAFLETYGDESIGRSAKPGVKKGLGTHV
jgi:hypothetical protein